jgi:hypothetical protein
MIDAVTLPMMQSSATPARRISLFHQYQITQVSGLSGSLI